MIKKLKIISVAIFCMVVALLSETQGMEVQDLKDLFYNTLKVETNVGSGTGFIFDFSMNTSPNLFLVTNKHVVFGQTSSIEGTKKYYAATGNLKFHCTNEKFINHKIGVDKEGERFYEYFKFHESSDLCILPLNNIIIEINRYLSENFPYIMPQQPNFTTGNINASVLQRTPVQVFYKHLNRSHLVNFNMVEPIQDILMVGYPIGLSDLVNNLPLLRKGITASHVGKNFQGNPEILIDAACFPGSSGSPVFINSPLRPQLLGILWGGPIHKVNGEVICDESTGDIVCNPIEIRKTATLIPVNLGFVIKSTQLDFSYFR